MEPTEAQPELVRHIYYIKRLGRQEMGSRDTRAEKAGRGRYLLVSREGLDFFPPHSAERLNDQAVIEFTPVFKLEGGAYPPRCYFQYVHHNSRTALGQANGRNEHRIYLSHRLDGGRFFQEDILVMRRRSIDPDAVNEQEGGFAPNQTGSCRRYFLDWIRRDERPDEWSLYDRFLTALATGRNYSSAIVEGCFGMFEAKVESAVPNGVEIDPRLIRGGAVGRPELLDDAGFRDFVFKAYGGSCAVTGRVLAYGCLSNLEALRVDPTNREAFNLPQNGIALRSDVGWAFNNGMFRIDPADLAVHVHEAVADSYLGEFEGMRIRLAVPELAPRPEHLERHADCVYGSFLRAGNSVQELR